jgi:hypothetical protein
LFLRGLSVEGSAADGRDGSAFEDFPVVAFADELGAIFVGFFAQCVCDFLVAAITLDAVAETAFGRTCAV